MKFGKKLRATVDTSYEEWRPMFMSYKELKKCIAPRLPDDAESRDSAESKENDPDEHDAELGRPVPDEPALHQRDIEAVLDAEHSNTQFFTRFKHEVDKVNEFFLDKQEDYIIEHRQLSAKADEYLISGRPSRAEVNRLRQRLTNFHGELVLLENYSTVNYTGFRKILKKHDKKTGLNMRKLYLKNVLTTPFFLSDTVRKLILKTEGQLAELDTIRKFRRHNPASALSLEYPSPLPHNGASPQHSSKLMSTSCAPITPPALTNLSPCTQVVMEPPRPHAFISPRSALWRLYSEARTYSTQLRDVMALTPPSKALPPPPQSLIDLVDAVSPNELGLVPMFLRAVSQPSNYCIAGEEGFSVGFFVFAPPFKLQIFKSHRGGAFITRNLRGKARVHCYETVAIEPDSKTSQEHRKTPAVPAEGQDFCVELTRTGETNGPWPAVTCHTDAKHVEWVPSTVCAVFYVCTPALVDDSMPRYDLHPLTLPRFRVEIHNGKDVQKTVRVMC